MTKSQLRVTQICLPSIILNITNNKDELWKTISTSKFSKNHNCNREKSLRHVAVVAKILDYNKPKTSLKDWIRTASNFIDLIQFHLSLAKFYRVVSERTVSKFSERKRKFLCCVHLLNKAGAWSSRKFDVAVLQWRLRNVQESVMHVQSCCFVNARLLLSCRSLSRRRCLN